MLFAGRISAFLPDESPWKDPLRSNSAFKPLLQFSFRALLLQVRGDWPFLRTMFRFPSWKSPIICWLCRAGPHGSDAPFTDCGLSCLWRQMRITCHEFLAMLRAQGFDLNPLLSLPAFTTACVVLDWLHIVDLGIGADILGCFFLGADHHCGRACWQHQSRKVVRLVAALEGILSSRKAAVQTRQPD